MWRRGIDYLKNAGDARHLQAGLAGLGRAWVTVGELLPQHGAAAVDTGPDSAQLHAQRLRHFVVRQSFKIAQNNGSPEIRWQFFQRTLNVKVQIVVLEALLRAWLTARQARL